MKSNDSLIKLDSLVGNNLLRRDTILSLPKEEALALARSLMKIEEPTVADDSKVRPLDVLLVFLSKKRLPLDFLKESLKFLMALRRNYDNGPTIAVNQLLERIPASDPLFKQTLIELIETCPENKLSMVLHPIRDDKNPKLRKELLPYLYKRLETASNFNQFLSIFNMLTNVFYPLFTNEGKDREALHQAFSEGLKKFDTRLLVKIRQSSLRQGYDDEDEQVSVTSITLIKKELDTREHILRPSQKKLIRTMSIHAGKKLSLADAQALSHRLNSKKKKT